MAKYSAQIENQKKEYIRLVEKLMEQYPEISYKRYTDEEQDKTRSNDIRVAVNDKIALVLNANEDAPGGTIRTNNVDMNDKANAVLMVGRTPDPEPDSIYEKYRHRPKWGHKWYKRFRTYEDCYYEMEKIVCMELGIPIPKKAVCVKK